MNTEWHREQKYNAELLKCTASLSATEKILRKVVMPITAASGINVGWWYVFFPEFTIRIDFLTDKNLCADHIWNCSKLPTRLGLYKFQKHNLSIAPVSSAPQGWVYCGTVCEHKHICMELLFMYAWLDTLATCVEIFPNNKTDIHFEMVIYAAGHLTQNPGL